MMQQSSKYVIILGLSASLLAAIRPSATETMTKVKSSKFLIWDEKAIRQKKKRNKGSQVNQVERVYCILPEETGFVYKKRKHFTGTSHGDAIGPIIAPSWEESRFDVRPKPVLGGIWYIIKKRLLFSFLYLYIDRTFVR